MSGLSPRLRRLALVTHVAVSVAFPGAVACFLAMAIVGLLGPPDLASAMYAGMQLITLCVVVPLCSASLLTGVICSLGTPWGLFRYWWVIVKLAATVVATAVLLLHLGPIDVLAHTSMRSVGTQMQMALAASAALLLLVVLVILSIYKPRGTTPSPL